MICSEAFPFVDEFDEFVGAIDSEMRQVSSNYGFSWIQRKWLSFCVIGTCVTGTQCRSQLNAIAWAEYSRSALLGV